MERSFDATGGDQSHASHAAPDGADERWPAANTQPGEERLEEISAQDVHKRCLDGQEVAFVKNKVTGSLNLSGELIDRPVRFTGCEFGDSIVLTGARATKGIRLERCKIHSLYGDRLSVEGDLLLEEVSSQGEISLCGARLTGHLRCTGSTFSQPSGKAFNAKGMMVGGSVLFDGGFSSEGEFILSFSRIDGTLDMTGGSFSNTVGPALVAEGIRVGTGMFLGANSLGANSNFEGTVILREAYVSGKIKCSGGHFAASPGEMAINAELIEADGVFLDTNFTAAGEVHLDSSTVTGKLFCNGGKFCNPGGIALSANGLDCQDMRLGHGFTATGEVSLLGAEISREFNCSGGKFNKGNKEKAAALWADGLICGGKVYLNEKTFHATGEVRLCNARITNELNCSNGTFENSEGTALNIGGLTCEGNVYLNEAFTAIGSVELTDVTVGRELNCEGGKFRKFTAQRLVVTGKFLWQPRETPEEVYLDYASIGLLRDHIPTSWPTGKTHVAGFTFRNLGDETLAKAKHRIEWLKHQGYSPGIYQQFARIYREKGLDREATKVAIEGYRLRRKGDRKGDRMPWPSRLWSWFLEHTVGYGYRIQRPLYILLVWGLVSTFFFILAQRHNIMVPALAFG